VKRIALCLLFLLGAATAASQPDAGPGLGEASPDSPRAAVAAFLELIREGKLAEAGRFFERPEDVTTDPTILARRFKAVLDRWPAFDLERISPRPEGKADDGLPPQYEEVGRIPVAGDFEPVRMERVGAPDGPRWRFSRSTTARIDVWYKRLENRWLLDHLPAALLLPGPAGLPWWQWLASPLFLAGVWLIGAVLGRLTRRAVAALARRTTITWDDELLHRLATPITLLWMIAAAYVLLPFVGLPEPARLFAHRALHTSVFIILLWSLVRSVDVGFAVAGQTRWAGAYPGSRSLLSLAARVAKVAVFAFAVVAIIAELGYPVASLLAGLGIGGLALALAAQKTVENVFGAFSIGVDQPFREGDLVRVDTVLGFVEAIGLRSTRIRTLDRTTVSIPNGKLADMRVETLATRDRMRLNFVVGLVYDTTAAQMREILAGCEGILRAHDKIWPDVVQVRFQSFGESSLNVEVQCWFQTSDWDEFIRIREDVLLQMMEVVERAGSQIAFPTRTVHVVGAGLSPEPAPAPAPERNATTPRRQET